MNVVKIVYSIAFVIFLGGVGGYHPGRTAEAVEER
jgi:hypothetical protein